MHVPLSQCRRLYTTCFCPYGMPPGTPYNRLQCQLLPVSFREAKERSDGQRVGLFKDSVNISRFFFCYKEKDLLGVAALRSWHVCFRITLIYSKHKYVFYTDAFCYTQQHSAWEKELYNKYWAVRVDEGACFKRTISFVSMPFLLSFHD